MARGIDEGEHGNRKVHRERFLDPDEAMTSPLQLSTLRTPDYIRDTRALLEQERL